MKDVLCMYYSRTGNTRKAMEEIASALGAELVELTDGVDRSGWRGWLRSGMDAMKRTPPEPKPYRTRLPLSQYRLVILGTPVWAGRCSSVLRRFLRAQGEELHTVAYVLTRGSENQSQEVFDQMDRYILRRHVAGVSLRQGSVGYDFWLEEFLRQVREVLEEAR